MTTATSHNRKSTQTLTLSLKDLQAFSLGLVHLANAVPERTTANQITFFLFAAFADIRGTPLTFNEIRELVGPTLGRSLHTTYRVFLDGNRTNGKNRASGLLWLHALTDPHDNRRKYLHLTQTGLEVMHGLLEAITSKKIDKISSRRT